MECYACDNDAAQRCPRCGKAYCADHGQVGPGAPNLCAECLDPVGATPTNTVFRFSLFAMLGASVLALWLLITPPSVPGDSPGVIQPPTATPADTTPIPPTPEPGDGTPTPPPGTFPPSTPTPAATPTPAPTPEPTPAPTPGPVEYVVQPGDTWFDIAVAFGVDAETLAAFNGQTLDDFLVIGEVLIIPQ